MEDAGIIALWLVGFLIAGPIVAAVMGVVFLVARGGARTAARVPGPVGRGLIAWERADPGTPTAAVAVVIMLVLLVGHWTGGLWQLLRIVVDALG